MTVEEAGGNEVEVWPDNVRAIGVFVRMSTQWRVGMGGASGLDYSVLPAVMRLTGVPVEERADVFESVRILEEAALKTMRKLND